MKKLIILMTLLSSPTYSNEVAPEYLKDAKITVTLVNGTTYEFSANEYMVAKRAQAKAERKSENVSETKIAETFKPEVKRVKHIVSLGVIESNSGELIINSGSSLVDVKSKRKVGAELQYQYRFYNDYYLGGKVDSNNGIGLNFGLGF